MAYLFENVVKLIAKPWVLVYLKTYKLNFIIHVRFRIAKG